MDVIFLEGIIPNTILLDSVFWDASKKDILVEDIKTFACLFPQLALAVDKRVGWGGGVGRPRAAKER